MHAGASQDNVVWLEAPDTGTGAPHLLEALSQSRALPPDLSARERLTRWQWEAFGGLIVALVVAALLVPVWLGVAAKVVFWLLFSLTVVWRLALTIIGVLENLTARPKQASNQNSDEDLPIYSIVIALRHEQNMMEQLATSLRAIDWPEGKLDIMLLIEADDPGTLDAALAAGFPAGTDCLVVPPAEPMTKPRALNYGLAAALGEYITVLDAEDRPHPAQLRDAYDLFRREGETLKCVQAPLVASNGVDGWLPAQWSLEYAVQFGLHVPALASLSLPVMLGGTSNHFRRADLIAFGGWDAWNVTEDADLGLRIARLGGRTMMIGSETVETAPENMSIWLNQRSRWIKGFVQTWLVCMRTPVSLFLELGPLRWLSLQLTLGGAIVSAFLYGPMVLMILLGTLFPQIFDYTPVDLGLFVAGCTGCLVADILAPGKWSLSRAIAIVTRPLYWPLLTAAAIKAVIGLVLRPSYWAKTPHMPSA
ncbi:glycosyltransferase family 2 protein [Henriciella marina]|uniref:glycosyltransferase family 2 protein n=1 Tax=Henriciella marina TaxID=453851 RepID=UPI00037D35A8|nr:glycosyltransferase [Henriciella marina]